MNRSYKKYDSSILGSSEDVTALIQSYYQRDCRASRLTYFRLYSG